MSKGSKQRPTNQAKFQKNYGNIQWGESKWVQPKRKVTTKAHHIMPDIAPYKAIAGEDAKQGKYITSRSKEREYLKRNNCVQVGDEKDYFFKYGGKSHDNPTRNWGREQEWQKKHQNPLQMLL